MINPLPKTNLHTRLLQIKPFFFSLVNLLTINFAIKYKNIGKLLCFGHFAEKTKLQPNTCTIPAQGSEKCFDGFVFHSLQLVLHTVYRHTHTNTSNEWSICFYFEPTVNRKWIMRYKQNTWPIHEANNICIQYQANVFCFWYPLNFMFAAAATCRFAESNLYHVFKTSRNCSARKHNKFGCVSVKVIHTLALFNLNSFWHSKNQMHKIIHRSIDYFGKKLRTKTK